MKALITWSLRQRENCDTETAEATDGAAAGFCVVAGTGGDVGTDAGFGVGEGIAAGVAVGMRVAVGVATHPATTNTKTKEATTRFMLRSFPLRWRECRCLIPTDGDATTT